MSEPPRELFTITPAPPHSCLDNADYRHLKAANELMAVRIVKLRSALEAMLTHLPSQVDISRAKDALDG